MSGRVIRAFWKKKETYGNSRDEFIDASIVTE